MFDSGFGGLTVARAVIDLLPHEEIVYLGDTARYPYGPRPQAEVREFAHQIDQDGGEADMAGRVLRSEMQELDAAMEPRVLGASSTCSSAPSLPQCSVPSAT